MLTIAWENHLCLTVCLSLEVEYFASVQLQTKRWKGNTLISWLSGFTFSQKNISWVVDLHILGSRNKQRTKHGSICFIKFKKFRMSLFHFLKQNFQRTWAYSVNITTVTLLIFFKRQKLNNAAAPCLYLSFLTNY